MKARIAVLDDERRMVDVLAMMLGREGYEVRPFVAAPALLQALEEGAFDLLISDLRMPEVDGLEVLRSVRKVDPELPVILLTAHGSVSSAISAMREGAFDYVEKPFDNDELKALVRRALDLTRLARENRYLRSELRSRYAVDRIVAESRSMRDVLELVRRAARSPATVLVTGESGTGKELVARSVHYHSDRVGGPFVAANCKSLAAGVLESELFGHERGAFTGAERARAGLFEQAHGGTLFLDEIGEVDLDFQGKLLRVLQEREVRRVGAEQTRNHRDLRKTGVHRSAHLRALRRPGRDRGRRAGDGRDADKNLSVAHHAYSQHRRCRHPPRRTDPRAIDGVAVPLQRRDLESASDSFRRVVHDPGREASGNRGRRSAAGRLALAGGDGVARRRW